MRGRWSPASLSGEKYSSDLYSVSAWWCLPQEAGAGAAVGDCADLRQDGPGPGHGPGDAPHDDHEEEDAEEEDEKQN